MRRQTRAFSRGADLISQQVKCSRICPLFILLACSLLAAQTRKLAKKDLPLSAFKLIAVKVTGTERYKPDEILGLAGLQIGQTVSDDDFKRTAQLLGETGAFSNVVYTYQYAPAGTTLELQLSDAEHFVPARFDNLVWFSDQELMEKVKERVPLFKGELPATGGLADMISDALQAMLIGRHVPGQADYLRAAQNDTINAIVFSVTGVDIRIRSVEFSGAGERELPLLTKAARPMRGQEYRRSMLRPQAEKNLLPVYLAEGFLKASIGEPETKVVQSDAEQTDVDVTFRIEPGAQYQLSDIQWSGNTVFPAGKLQPLIHLQAGQAANAIQLSQDLDGVRKLYGTRGYMTVSVETVPQMDDNNHRVSYRLQVHEGEQYKMGDVEIVGLDSKTMYRLLDIWKLRGGEVYDSSYPRRFLSEVAAEGVAMMQWSVEIHETPNQDKTVDVSLRFNPRDSR